MTFDKFIELMSSLPCFDMAAVIQLTDDSRATVTNQLYRWSEAGKLIRLRQGVYTLADRYRQTPLPPATLANIMYRPSYLSGLWALSYYGLIPDAVPVYTSITTRTPRQFNNPFGVFTYTNIKQDFFFGYHEIVIAEAAVLLAAAEKALLDVFHLTKGEWDPDRMTEMRFQQTNLINRDLLQTYAGRMGKPRISRAVETWLRSSDEEDEGSVEL